MYQVPFEGPTVLLYLVPWPVADYDLWTEPEA